MPLPESLRSQHVHALEEELEQAKAAEDRWVSMGKRYGTLLDEQWVVGCKIRRDNVVLLEQLIAAAMKAS